MCSYKRLSAVYYITTKENVLDSAGPALTFLMLVSLPLIQTVASSAIILDLKFLIPLRWTVCPSLIFGFYIFPSLHITNTNLSLFHSELKQLERSFKACMY